MRSTVTAAGIQSWYLLGSWQAVLLGSWCGGEQPLAEIPGVSQPRLESVLGSELRQLIEEDWLKSLIEPVTTRSDAAGAVDGIKDGKYAFHTGLDARPWWQVDLGGVQSIARIVVHNRLDYAPGLHNADTLIVLTSDDGRQWTQRYDNQGRHFGGISGAPPLDVTFPDGAVRARFVRLQIPSAQPIFFHLDEVEVFGPADPAKNLALHQPADQSSLSQWSTAKIHTRRAFPTLACIERGRELAAHLGRNGVDVSAHQAALDQAERGVPRVAARRIRTDCAAARISRLATQCGVWCLPIRSWISTDCCSSSDSRRRRIRTSA